jgi:hypothetical protein
LVIKVVLPACLGPVRIITFPENILFLIWGSNTLEIIMTQFVQKYKDIPVKL